MWGDELQLAINIINRHVEAGNTVYLWKDDASQNIELKEGELLKHMLMSEVVNVKSKNKFEI